MGDSLHILSKFTFARGINYIKLVSSYYLSRLLRSKKALHWGMPVSISIEPTTTCNLACPECPSGMKQFSRNTGNLDINLFKKIMDELSPYVSYLTFYFQGEPFIHPQFLEMVRFAADKNIYISTSTNAHFLSDEMAKATVKSGLSRLIISIDGTTQEIYETYRKKGTLDKVIEGTKNIVKWKKQLKSSTPYLEFQFLVVKDNEHQIGEIKDLAKTLGVNKVNFKTAQLNNYKEGNALMPTIDKYSRYKKLSDGTYRIKNKMHNHCWRMWSSGVITWDGVVVPCCFDKDAQYAMGNMQQNSFEQIWHSETYQHFRSSLLLSRKGIDICNNCTEGTNTID